VSKSTTGPAGSASRRAILLNSVSIAAGGFILSAPAARTALAQPKLTHEIAKYQDTPKNDQKCSTCILFVTPDSCKIVVDPILTASASFTERRQDESRVLRRAIWGEARAASKSLGCSPPIAATSVSRSFTPGAVNQL
jgi:hypothetical protein